MTGPSQLPELPLAQWQDTYATLHRWVQIVGKTRLVLAPMQNHYWQATFYISTRGLRTSPIPYQQRSFEVEFDFIEHCLRMQTSDGRQRSMKLRSQPTRDFYSSYMNELRALGIEVRIWPVPNELPDRLPFPDDSLHESYDPDAAHRCWLCMVHVDRVLNAFRDDFLGKKSPSHFWWGSFDMACTRFSGRSAPPHPGGIPNLPDRITREAYSHECISAGWWPGSVGGAVAEPAYYAYAYPEPAGCPAAAVEPAAAYYHPELHEWILPYSAVSSSADPDQMVRDFLQSTYDAASRLGSWPSGLTRE